MSLVKKCVLLLLALLFLFGFGAWIVCPAESGQQSAVRSATTLEMPIAKAWEKLQDLSLAHNYVPGLVATEIVTEQKMGIGASRRVYQGPDKYLNETVVEWEPGFAFKIRLHDDEGGAPLPFKQAWFTYRLVPEGEHRTRLETELAYEMAGGCLGQWLDRLLLSETLQKRADDVPNNLKRFYETGQSWQASLTTR